MPKKLAPLRFTVLVARWTETAAALERIFRRLDAQGAWQYACHSIADGAGLVPEEALASDAAARFIHEADLVWVFSEEAARLLEKRARRVVVSRLPSLVEDHG